MNMMQTRGETIAVGTLLLLLGLFVSALTYVLLYGAGLLVLALGKVETRMWAHVIAGGYLLAALISVARTSADYWSEVSFDTSDAEDRSSPFGIGRAGRTWNASGTFMSFSRGLAALISSGPHFLAQGIRELMLLKHNTGEDAVAAVELESESESEPEKEYVKEVGRSE